MLMITIGVLGFAPAEEQSISIALKSRAKGVSFVSDLSDARVVLVDVDRIGKAKQWRLCRSQNNSLLIDVSENNALPDKLKRDFVASLRKPLRFSEMLSVICEAADKQSVADSETACKASNARIHIASGGAKTNLSKINRSGDVVDPSKYLLGSLLSAISQTDKERYHSIHMSGDQWIILDRQDKSAYLSIKQKVFRHMAILPIHDLQITQRTISESDFRAQMMHVAHRCSFEELIWFLTRCTVRDQLQLGLSLDRNYRLKHWPNLARLPVSDADIPLANLWIESTNSILSLTERCNQPIDKARSFAACCYNCGLLEEVSETFQKADTHRTNVVSPQKRMRKVLTMFLGKLAA
jgi:hypothetical protein